MIHLKASAPSVAVTAASTPVKSDGNTIPSASSGNPVAGQRAIVIDCGSGMCKAGLAGEIATCKVFPSLVGRLKNRLSKIPNHRKILLLVMRHRRRVKSCR